MDVKKLALATLAGGVVMWLLAGLWHMVLMVDLYEAEGGPTHEGAMVFIVIGYLVLALLMAYMYPIGYGGGKPVIEGLKFGVVIGLVWLLPHGLVMTGVQGGSVSFVLIDTCWHLVEQGIGGIIIGLVYGMGEAAEHGESEVAPTDAG